MGPWRSVKMKMGSLLVDVSRVTDGKQRKMHALNLVCLHFFQKIRIFIHVEIFWSRAFLHKTCQLHDSGKSTQFCCQ